MKILVVGGGHHKMQEAKDLQILKEGADLTLVREPKNPYDKNAIAVACKGLQIGYVAKNKAKDLAEKLDNGAGLLSCKVTKLYASSLDAELIFEGEDHAEA